MDSERTTRDYFIERYHSLRGGRGSAGLDVRSRRVMWRTFDRSLGSWLPTSRDDDILDVGCGEGAFLAYLTDQGYTNLFAFDLSPENVDYCHRRGLTFVERFDALAVEDFHTRMSWKAIYCLDLLEHLPKEGAVTFLRALHSRLKSGGHLVIQTPNMGSVLGVFHRYNDLSHEWGLTEFAAIDLLTTAGFEREQVEVRPAWSASTLLGRARERYLRILHQAVFVAEGSQRPRIPTRNLLIRASNA